MSVVSDKVQAFFYRTAAGAEIDLLLKVSSKELWAVEIKSGLAPKVQQGFHIACEDVKATHKYVVYGGEDEFPIEKNTTVISLKKILLKLQEGYS